MSFSPYVRSYSVQYVSLSPKGDSLATADSESINIWSPQGYILRTLAHKYLTGIKFSNSGRFLASFDSVRGIYLWDPGTGRQLKKVDFTVLPWAQVVLSIDFNPSDSLLAAAITDSVKIWDINRGTEILTIVHAHGNENINRVYFADNGRALVTGSNDGVIKIWDLKGKNTKQIKVEGLTDFTVYKFGKEIISCTSDKVFIWGLNGKLLTEFKIAPYKFPDPNVVDMNTRKPVINSIPPRIVKASYFKNTKTILTLGTRGLQAWSRDGHMLWEGPEAGNSGTAWKIAPAPDGVNIAISSRSGFRLWNSQSKEEKYFNSSIVCPVLDFEVFPSTSFITSSMRVFDLSGKILRDLSGGEGPAIRMAASPDGNFIAVSYTGGNVSLFNSAWDLLNSFPTGQGKTPLSFSPDSKKLVMLVNKQGNAYARIYEVPGGRILSEIPVSLGAEIYELQFVKENILLIGTQRKDLSLLDINSGQFIKTLANGLNSLILNPSFITEKGDIGTPVYGKVILLWNSFGEFLREIKVTETLDGILSGAATYNPQKRFIAAGGFSGGIYIIDYESGKIIRKLEGESKVTRVKFSSDGSFLYSSAEDAAMKVWDTKNWQEASIVATPDNEWAIYTPDGYFDSSPHGGELVKMVNGLDGYGIDQFAVRNNRPDLILERMGTATPEEISFYHMQYQRRLKKLGLSETALSSELHVPEVKITGTKRNGKFAEISSFFSDAKYRLKEYSLYINAVPVFAANEKKIQGNSLAVTDTVELTPGKNKIEVSVMNEAGVESYRALTYMDYSGKEKGALYYLAFGVSKYKDETLNLSYADKDVKDFETAILKMRPGYSDVRTKILLNSDVTAENIKKAKDFLKAAEVDDTVVLFIAGHGGYDKSRTPQYYYLPHEADLSNMAGTGINFEKIEDILSGIKPRKKLFLLDTCESGEIDEDTYSKYFAMADARGFKPRTYRKPLKGRGQASKKARPYLYIKDRFIYNDLARRSGAVVFSSSRGNEISYESSEIQNGFFSHEIIKALTSKIADKDLNGKVSNGELLNYVREAVARKTAGLQNPTTDRDNLYQKIEFPLVLE